jgi:hypothetical protein
MVPHDQQPVEASPGTITDDFDSEVAIKTLPYKTWGGRFARPIATQYWDGRERPSL